MRHALVCLVGICLLVHAAADAAENERRQCRYDLAGVLPKLLASLTGAAPIHLMARMHTAIWRWVRNPCSLVTVENGVVSANTVFMGDMVDPSFGDDHLPDQKRCRRDTVESFHRTTVRRLRACAADVKRCREFDLFTALAKDFVKWEHNPCDFKPRRSKRDAFFHTGADL
jgi:hypothetical protein